MKRTVLITLGITSALVAAGLVAGATPTTAADTAVTRTNGTRLSRDPDISADGRFVVFSSKASKLVPGDTNREEDVFVRDMVTGAITRVSVGDDGEQGELASRFPSITPDGRYVVFDSLAPGFVPGDTSDGWDVFVRDLRERKTIRASVANDADSERGGGAIGSISDDGSKVAFQSWGYGLVEGVGRDEGMDVFVRDLRARTTSLVSATSQGRPGNRTSGSLVWDLDSAGAGGQPRISGDGRYVAFASQASDLVDADTNGVTDVFVRDLQEQRTERVSLGDHGQQANGQSTGVDIDTEGRFVAFDSNAENLVDGDTNGEWDVFVRDLREGTLTRASVTGDEHQAGQASWGPRLGDGARYVAFSSRARELAGETPQPEVDPSDIPPRVYVRDLRDGATTVVDQSPVLDDAVTTMPGRQWQSGSGGRSYPALAGESDEIVFTSWADDLVERDSNGSSDVFLSRVGSSSPGAGNARLVSTPTPSGPAGCAWDDRDAAVGLPGHSGGSGAVQVNLGSSGARLLTRAGIDAGKGSPGDRFGAAVAATDLDASACMSVVVGAPGAAGSGRVYLVSGIGSETPEVITVAAPARRAAAGDRFGSSVALAYRRTAKGTGRPQLTARAGTFDLWVGVPGRDVGGARDAGAVEHFLVAMSPGGSTPAKVTHVETLTQDSPGVPGASEAGDGFGQVLRTSDRPYYTRLVVGVPAEDITVSGGRDAKDAGAVVVVATDPVTGGKEAPTRAISQNTRGVPGAAEAGDRFGAAVATAREEILVGIPGEDLGPARDAGAVQEFRHREEERATAPVRYVRTLHQNQAQTPGAAEAGDRFGAAVALQNNSTNRPVGVVGIPGEDLDGVADAGAVSWRVLRAAKPASTLAWRGHGLPGQRTAGDRLGIALGTRFIGSTENVPILASAGAATGPGAGPGSVLSWFLPPYTAGQPSVFEVTVPVAGDEDLSLATDTTGI